MGEVCPEFEKRFVQQGKKEDRSIQDTLNLGWDLFGAIPKNELTRVDPKLRDKYYKEKKDAK